MEYSLKTLNENSDLKDLQTSKIIERLNLIGFEVDGLITESTFLSSFEENLKLLIKIPANREDLLNEKLFLLELSNLFWLKLNQPWEDLKKDYSFLCKQKYFSYSNYQSVPVKSDLSDLFLFQIPIELSPNFISPLWIQEKLINAGLPATKSIQDLFKLATLEWGQSFQFFEEKIKNSNKSNAITSDRPFFSSHIFSQKWTLEKLKKPEVFIDSNQNEFIIEKNIIVLKNEEGLIKTILGLSETQNDFPLTPGKIIFLQAIFYDIYENNLSLNSIQNKLSFRYLRQQYLEYVRFSFQRLLTLFEITKAAKLISTISSYTSSKIHLPFKKILCLNKQFLTSTLKIEVIDFNIFLEAGLFISCETPLDIYFSVPTHRKDLERPIDLIEEYSRYIGYDNFKPIFPTKLNSYFQSKNKNSQLIKQILLSYGFQEILTNPLQDSKKQELNSVFLQNPLNNEFYFLRNTLLDKIISIFETNYRLSSSQTNFFEIGRTFVKDFKINQLIEKERVAGIFQLSRIKKENTPTTEWFMARGMIESFLSSFGISNFSFEINNQQTSVFHPKKSILIKKLGKIIGLFGEISPNTDLKFRNLKYPVYIFEFDISLLNSRSMKSTIPFFEEYSKYPTIVKDISIIAKKTNNFFRMQTLLKNFQINSILLKRFKIFDIYFEETSKNEVAIGIRLYFKSELDTLTGQDIEIELSLLKNLFLENFDVKVKD